MMPPTRTRSQKPTPARSVQPVPVRAAAPAQPELAMHILQATNDPAQVLAQDSFTSIQRQQMAQVLGQGVGNRQLLGILPPMAAPAAVQRQAAPAQTAEAAPQAAQAEAAPAAPQAHELSWGERVARWGFEKAVAAAGVEPAQIHGLIDRAGGAIAEIIKDPGRFVNTMIKAVGQGFTQFKDNISAHLQRGLMGWLFGTLTKAGIQLPKDFSLKSILTLVLQVLGITVEAMKQKAARFIGEKNVRRIEKLWDILSTFMKEGIGGLWEMLKDYLGDLKEMVVSEVKSWVITQVIQAAVVKVLSMFNPVSGLITIIKTIYNVIKFFIERAGQITALFQAIAGSVAELAVGNVKGAADKVEQALGRVVPVAIGLLASLLGLSGLSDKIREIIKKIQTTVDKAIDKAIEKIVAGRKKLFGKGGKKKEEKEESKGVIGKVKQELAGQLNKPVSNAGEIQPIITSVYNKFKPEGLKYLNVVEASGKAGEFNVVASASPESKVAAISTVLGIDIGDLLPLVSKAGFGRTTLTAYMLVGDRQINLRTHENTREEDLQKPERHAEKQLLEELRTEWSDEARKDKNKDQEYQIVIQVTRSPCADCSLVLNQFVQDKRSKGFNVNMTIKVASLYGGVEKDKEGKMTPRYEGTKIALQDLHKPGMKIEPWDIFALLEERGVKIDPKVMSLPQQEKLKRRIAEVKTVLDGIQKVKAAN